MKYLFTSLIKVNVKNHARIARDFVLDLIFPVECLNCGKEGQWLCSACFNTLSYKSDNYCFGCKKRNLFGEFCPNCQTDYYLDGIWIAGDYDNKVIAGMIKKLKYNLIKDIAGILGNYMSIYLHKVTNIAPVNGFEIIKNEKLAYPFINTEESIIIPVPLHKKRLKWRGFNQAELLAGIIARNFGISTDSVSLQRIKNNKPQAGLKEKDRLYNLTGCFAWTGKDLNGQTIILVDDIATTGATLNECAKILKQNGAEEVWGLVAAKG